MGTRPGTKSGKMTGVRRQGRSLAMKILYQSDLGGQSLDLICSRFEEYLKAPERAREFARTLADGVMGKKADIDGKIVEALKGWEFDRLAEVDKQLLRVAAFELLYCEDISANVTMDEAIEIAKTYSGEDASRFINGVLANICRRYASHKVEKRETGNE